jgi:hypothetical protein
MLDMIVPWNTLKHYSRCKQQVQYITGSSGITVSQISVEIVMEE